MKIHENGGGQVADTATVDPNAYIGPDCKVLDSAHVAAYCRVENGATIYGTAVLSNNSTVDGSKVGGTALLNATNIHSNVVLEKTPITIHGFEYDIIVADTFIIIGCKMLPIDDWQTKIVLLMRSDGWPKKSAIRVRDSIKVVLDCYRSVYHEDDLKDAFKFG